MVAASGGSGRWEGLGFGGLGRSLKSLVGRGVAIDRIVCAFVLLVVVMCDVFVLVVGVDNGSKTSGRRWMVEELGGFYAFMNEGRNEGSW